MISNLNGPLWDRARASLNGGTVPRKTLKPVPYYSTELPRDSDDKPVILRYSGVDKCFVLSHGTKELGRRRQEVVLQWERPERVFGYLARVWLSGRKFPEEE